MALALTAASSVTACFLPSTSRKEVKQQTESHECTADKKHVSLTTRALLCIFGFLSPEDLGRTSCVCREWQVMASEDHLWRALDLKKIFRLTLLDEKVWETHVDCAALGLDLTGAPPLTQNKETVRFLKGLCAQICAQVEGDAGITLLTLPKGLTLNKLEKLASSPKQGNAAKFLLWAGVSKTFGDAPVDKTYRVLITNNVLKGSRMLTVYKQHELGEKMGWEMPGMLPVATLTILTYMSSPAAFPIHLYSNDEPRSLTRCKDQLDGGYNLVVGFAKAKIIVFPNVAANQAMGMGGMRELTVPMKESIKTGKE